MNTESNVTWWKIVFAVLGPAVLFVPAATTLAGIMAVASYLWTYIGLSQALGNILTLGLVFILMFVLYALHARSPNARVWFTLPFFVAVLLAALAVTTFGFSGILVVRLLIIALIITLYVFTGWVIWKVFEDV